LFGSTNERDKTDPHTRETALGSPSMKRRSSGQFNIHHLTLNIPTPTLSPHTTMDQADLKK